MKILLVQDTDWIEREAGNQYHLADRLSLKGHEVRAIDYEILWRTKGKRELFSRRQIFAHISKTIEGADITVIRPGIIKLPWLDYISLIFSYRVEIDRQLKEFVPDVIWGLGILSPYLAMKAAQRSGCPFIYHQLEISHKLIPFKLFQPIGIAIEKRIFRQADRILVTSENLKELVIRMGASPERTYVAKTGVDFERFKPGINREQIRAKYKLEPRDIVLFFMGWLYNFSGLKEVALQLAKMRDNNLKLLIVGEGDAYEELKKIREKYNLQNRVILTGKRPYQEMPSLVAASDICLLPSQNSKVTQDLIPVKMYEYMAMEKAVISTGLPGIIKEFAEDNGVVYVDKPEDVIPKAIELVAEGNLAELGLKARKFAQSYSWDNITDEFERILEGSVKSR